MQTLNSSDDVIEAMVDAMFGSGAAEYDRNIYREALQGLVHLAQAEQLLAMQLDSNSAASGFPVQTSCSRH
jgi:hypothetical protein